MFVQRSPNNKTLPLDIVGSSVFGIYKKMDSRITYNMTISDGWLVPYPGYKLGVPNSEFNDSTTGRGLYESVKSDAIYAIYDDKFYQVRLDYDHVQQKILSHQVNLIGTLSTSSGVVYIVENNKPQILLSDNTNFYLYDPTLSVGSFTFTSDGTTTLSFDAQLFFDIGEPITFTGTPPNPLSINKKYYIASFNYDSSTKVTTISIVEDVQDVNISANYITVDSGTGTLFVQSNFFQVQTSFVPGYVTFHDTYFLAAASQDTFYYPVANNTFRLSDNNNGFLWLDIAQRVGILETKPDNTQAVVRFPSKGNLILVMGKTVTEFWYDTGVQLFPYQRTSQTSIDYGCVNPATVAYMDEIVIWLGQNEQSGPIILYTTGGEPTKVTTDGIDFMLSEINNPEDSQGFLFRKNGHLFYHLNFYTDNFSFVVDITTNKIFNATDQDMNYYIMGKVVWFNNQYFSITKDNGNLFVFDTVFTTYDNFLPNGAMETVEIPRIRICDNIRFPNQNYVIVTDIGFTIETGETSYHVQEIPNQDESHYTLVTQNGDTLVTQDGDTLISEQLDPDSGTTVYRQTTPCVDLSLSFDGGASYTNPFRYELNPIGRRKNRLMWWQLGIGNDIVPQFRFWGFGEVVCTDGEVNVLL